MSPLSTSARYQRREIGFEESSGATAAREFALWQVALGGEVVHRTQRATQAAGGFGAANEALFRLATGSHRTGPRTVAEQR